jgi:apolipoprotein D and lipocalin family protein
MSTLTVLFSFVTIAASAAVVVAAEPPKTVSQVELKRYLGVWYEIARMPNRFQKKCVGNTTAEYAFRDDASITVVNRCMTENGKMDQVTGVARIVAGSGNAKLQVSFVSLFGFRLFWGDYWIIGLDPDYRWAIVGHPARTYGWILSRQPHLTDEDKNRIFSVLREQGYDPAFFQWTEHRAKS